MSVQRLADLMRLLGLVPADEDVLEESGERLLEAGFDLSLGPLEDELDHVAVLIGHTLTGAPQPVLFEPPPPERQPLAARMRPRTLDEVIGQRKLLAPGQPLRRAVESGRAGSDVNEGRAVSFAICGDL